MKKKTDKKFLINIFGLPAVGKSTLRNAMIEDLEEKNCGKIPGDHYLKSKPVDVSFFDYFTHVQYDWELIKKHLNLSLGETVGTPLFDYKKFVRISESGSPKKFTVRKINVVDTCEPCPFADLRILITLNEEERKRRVEERGRTDYFWKKYVLENWDKVEASDRKNAKNHRKKACLVLDGQKSVGENVRKAVNFVKNFRKQYAAMERGV